jgi:glycosyltransferase involved in cell wall biosynthesis
VEGETGLLVDEHDVAGMARHMVSIAENAEIAGRLGGAARQRIQQEFELGQSIERLWSIIQSSTR